MEESCRVCQVGTHSCCKACYSAYYCSKAHQKMDWKKSHKVECFPVRAFAGLSGFRELRTTKDVKEGQVLLEEIPLLQTPITRTANGLTCLGCCVKLETATSCRNCGWPLCVVCNEGNQEHGHGENECKIFQEAGVTPNSVNLGNTYNMLFGIGVLRMLLLRDRDPSGWSKLMALDSFSEIRKKNPDAVINFPSISRFILRDCRLLKDLRKGKAEELVDEACGILRGNAFDTTDSQSLSQNSSEPTRCASLIFEKAIIPGENCIPNAFYSIQGHQAGMFKITITAAVDIRKGSPISLPYGNEITGTFLRRKLKEAVFYQRCVCDLCQDSSELRTYISSLACRSQSTSCEGFMLSVRPLESGADWRCEKCGFKMPSSDMLDVLQSTKAKLQEYVNHPTLDESSRVLDELKRGVLHPNHFLILQAEMELCRKIFAIIGFDETKSMEPNISKALSRLIEMSNHLLNIADILRPGLSRLRGRLLYYLQLGTLLSLLHETGEKRKDSVVSKCPKQFKTTASAGATCSDARKKMEDLIQLQKQAEAILSLETNECSEEYKMLTTLRGELKMAMEVMSGNGCPMKE